MTGRLAVIAGGGRAAGRLLSRYWRRLFAAVFMLALITFWVFEPPATFTVSADTEFLKLDVGPSPVRWYFKNATLSARSLKAPIYVSGSVEFVSGATVVAERVGRGLTTIECHVDSPDQAVAIVYGPSEAAVETVNGRATIRVGTTTSGPVSTAAFGLAGAVTVGNQIRMITVPDAPLLKHGKVHVFGKTLVTETLFDAGSADLEQGDFVELNVSDGPAVGLLTIDERPGMQALVKTVAATQLVNTFQGGGFTMSASAISRLQHDPLVQSFWVAAGSLWGLLTSISKRSRR